jgi:predicted amidophosphoribosyltransferase
MFCDQCGAKVTSGGKYCTECGNRLEPIEPRFTPSVAEGDIPKGIQN